MRNLVLSICFLTFACATEERTVCDDYCDTRVIATEYDATVRECIVYDDDLDGFEDNCLNTCNTVLEHVVEDQHKHDAESCLRCLNRTIGQPSGENLSTVRETCYKECNTRGGKQFFFTFYISPPKWECNGEWRIFW